MFNYDWKLLLTALESSWPECLEIGIIYWQPELHRSLSNLCNGKKVFVQKKRFYYLEIGAN